MDPNKDIGLFLNRMFQVTGLTLFRVEFVRKKRIFRRRINRNFDSRVEGCKVRKWEYWYPLYQLLYVLQ
jgi:hypothetical protein